MQIRHRGWTLAFAIAFTLTVPTLAHNVGSQAGAGTKFPDPRITFKKYTLPNGLEVILHQDKTVPLVAVDVWYHVGSGDEVPGKSGFAHLFEHMMFQGTKNTGEDQHFQILQQIGSSDSNGSTNPNRTNYYEVIPSNQLEVALWLESERMGYLPDAITEKSLANQRDVVRNERRQSYDNVPFGKDAFATAAALYPEGHPYRYLTIGLHEDVEGGSLDDVKGFFRKWYAPIERHPDARGRLRDRLRPEARREVVRDLPQDRETRASRCRDTTDRRNAARDRRGSVRAAPPRPLRVEHACALRARRRGARHPRQRPRPERHRPAL